MKIYRCVVWILIVFRLYADLKGKEEKNIVALTVELSIKFLLASILEPKHN